MSNNWLLHKVIGPIAIIAWLATSALSQVAPIPHGHDHDKSAEVDSLDDLLSEFTEDYIDLMNELEEMMEEFEALFEDYGRISLKETEKSLYQLQKHLYNEYSENARTEMMIQLEETLKNLKMVELDRDDANQYSVRKYLRRLRAMEEDLEDIGEQLEEEFEELDELEIFDSDRISRAVNRALKDYYSRSPNWYVRSVPDVTDIRSSAPGTRVPKVPRLGKMPTLPGKLGYSRIGTYTDLAEFDNFLTRTASIDVEDGEVIIALENALGGVTVSTWSRNEVKAELTIGYSEDSQKSKLMAEKIELSIFNYNGQMVTAKVNYPTSGDQTVNIVSSQLNVTLPRSNQVKIDNSFGPVSVSDLDNKIIVNSGFAQVEIENINGDVMLNNANGTLYFNQINGRLTANNSFGSIEAVNITGDIRLTNSYAPITTLKTIGQLDIKSSGAVSVRKHKGNAEIYSSNGDMEIYGIQGNLSAINSFGDMRVEGIMGDAELENSNSLIEVYKVQGTLRASNRFADIHVEAIRKKTWVECSNGEVTIENVNDAVVVSNRFGDVTIRSIDGDVQVQNSGSPVIISEVRGNVEVVNQHAPVFLEEIGGNVDVENQNASVDLFKIAGATIVSTTHGLISCDQLNGSFNIGNESGSVELIDIAGISEDCQITTTFGDITLTLPKSGKFNLKAYTSWGEIVSAFPMNINSQGPISSGEYISGKSEPTIILSGKNSSIIVLME